MYERDVLTDLALADYVNGLRPSHRSHKEWIGYNKKLRWWKSEMGMRMVVNNI